MGDDKTSEKKTAAPAPGGVLDGAKPANRERSLGKPAKRQPSAGVQQFRVRTRGMPRFRRVGIAFTPDVVTVNAASLTPEQQLVLLNTPALEVEEIGGGGTPRAPEKAKKE